jgi:hypothetical protein
MANTVRVRGVIREGKGLFVARPGQPGRWLGFESCSQAEAEVIIAGAPGRGRRDQTSTSDMFPRGQDIYLRRTEETLSDALPWIGLVHRAITDGDLEEVK